MVEVKPFDGLLLMRIRTTQWEVQHDEYLQSQRTGVWKQYKEAAHRGPTRNCNL